MLGQVGVSLQNGTFLFSFNNWELYNINYCITNKYKAFILRGIILFSESSSSGQAETVFYKIVVMTQTMTRICDIWHDLFGLDAVVLMPGLGWHSLAVKPLNILLL